MKLAIISTINKEVIFNQDVTDKHTSGMNYAFDVSLPEGIPSGEYEYRLTDGDTILSTGLMQIGGYNAPDQYEQTTTYRQYESE